MRLLNRPLAFVLALALTATGVIVIIEVIAFAVHARPVVVPWTTWYRWAERTHWKAGVVRFWSVVLIVVGAVVLLIELKPRRVRRLGVRSDNADTDAAMTRGGLAGALRASVTDVDGISRATVSVKRHRVRVAAKAAARDAAGAAALTDPVTAAVDARLQELQLVHPPRVRVRVSARSK
ncbi:MAG: DUF6286 domain-containing protein [Jatrophihabitantaceae bacterium]